MASLLIGGLLATGLAQPAPLPAPEGPFAGPPEEGVWYEIFVRSFQDADGDGTGDLPGVTSRLPYLADLGVDGIWLTPIHPAASYHGYDVLDATAVAPEYGTLADLDALIEEAHALGIRVILDLVPNHTARDHPWFRAALAGDRDARDRYVWRDHDPGWTGLGGPSWHRAGDAWYLGLFGAGMPDLNHENAEVRAELRRVMRFWLERGVDGFRVDAIQHLIEGDDGAIAGTPATLAWVREMQAWLRATAPHAFWLGETYALSAPAVAAYHREGDLDMSLDYPLWDALSAALSQRSAAPLETALRQNAELYPAGAARAVFSANHDQLRPATTLGVLRRDEPRLRLVAALLATLPGTPLLYYGQEIGLPNGPGDRDEQKRTPMPWRSGPGRGFSDAEPWIAFSTGDPALTVEAQRADPASLWSRYREVLALRRATPELARGRTTLLEPEAASLLAFVRELDGDAGGAGGRVLVAVNLASRPAVLAASERPGTAVATLDGAEVGPGDWEIEGLGVRVVRLAPAGDDGATPQ
jgi:glycosidase